MNEKTTLNPVAIVFYILSLASTIASFIFIRHGWICTHSHDDKYNNPYGDLVGGDAYNMIIFAERGSNLTLIGIALVVLAFFLFYVGKTFAEQSKIK